LTLRISADALNEIMMNNQRGRDRCLFMMKKWLEIDCSPCYCKLISAVITEDNHSLAEEIKEAVKIKPGKILAKYYFLIYTSIYVVCIFYIYTSQ